MKCEVCGCQYRKIESSLICQNGHTLQNMTEVAHDDVIMSARTKRVRKSKKVKTYFTSSGCNLMKMILFKLVFEEAKIFFNFPEDSVFKYFSGFFEFREGKLESSLDVTEKMFYSLIYLAKRADCEKKGEQLFFEDFHEKLLEFNFINRLALIKNRFPALEPPVKDLFHSTLCFSILLLKNKIVKLSTPFIMVRPYRLTSEINKNITPFPSSFGSGVFEECIDGNKRNFRALFKNDISTIKPYFLKLCTQFEIQLTDELNLYFEKFIYTFDNTKIIFPEYDLTMFLAMYAINTNNFEDTEFESKVSDYLGLPKTSLRTEIANLAKEYNLCASPEIYVSSLQRRNRQRHLRLKQAVQFIDTYKMLKGEKLIAKRVKKKNTKRLKEAQERNIQIAKSSEDPLTVKEDRKDIKLAKNKNVLKLAKDLKTIKDNSESVKDT
jgi:hypothetical protein